VTRSDILRRLRADLWQPPRAHGEILRDRTVGPLELFYDLVVVVLVAQAAHRLAAHLTPRGLAEFAMAVLFLASVALVFAVVPGEFDSAVAVTDALNERFGLLVIIVLGETVTGVVSGLTADPTSAHKLAVGVVCVLVGFGSWWTYFDFVGHRQPRNTRPGTVTWLLGHLPVSAAIAGIGATMPTLVTHAAEHRTASAPTWMLCGSAAVLLVFTTVLMISLQDWHSAAPLLHPLALANLAAGAAAVCIGLIRPAPLVLCILLVLTFGAPWTFAVLRRAGLDVGASETGHRA